MAQTAPRTSAAAALVLKVSLCLQCCLHHLLIVALAQQHRAVQQLPHLRLPTVPSRRCLLSRARSCRLHLQAGAPRNRFDHASGACPRGLVAPLRRCAHRGVGLVENSRRAPQAGVFRHVMSGQVRRPQTAERRESLDGQEKRSAWNADHSPAHTIAPHASTSGQHEAWRHRQDRTWGRSHIRAGHNRSTAAVLVDQNGAARCEATQQRASYHGGQPTQPSMRTTCGGVGSEVRSALQSCRAYSGVRCIERNSLGARWHRQGRKCRDPTPKPPAARVSMSNLRQRRELSNDCHFNSSSSNHPDRKLAQQQLKNTVGSLGSAFKSQQRGSTSAPVPHGAGTRPQVPPPWPVPCRFVSGCRPIRD